MSEQSNNSYLYNLRDKILLFGGQCELAITSATKALINRDSTLAKQVITNDDEIDLIESEIDQLCVDIILLKLPSPEDLRFIIGVARTTPIIERIADHAVNIARHTLKLNDEPQLKSYIDLSPLVNIVHQMLISALDAFARGDSLSARELIRQDDQVDILYRRIFNELLSYMSAHPSEIVSAAEMLFVIKHFERVADYVTNICEQIVYMSDGYNIKHLGRQSI